MFWTERNYYNLLTNYKYNFKYLMIFIKAVHKNLLMLRFRYYINYMCNIVRFKNFLLEEVKIKV